MDEPLNLVLFSGTDDKLQAAAVLTAGAAALGKPGQRLPPVLGARRVPRRPDRGDHGLAPEAGPRPARSGRCAARRRPGQLGGDAAPGQGPRRGRHPGLLPVDGPPGADQSDLDPLVDGVEGVTAFYLNAGDGQSSSSERSAKGAPHDHRSDHATGRRPRAVLPDADRADRPGDEDARVGRAHRGPRDRSGLGQGLRGVVAARPATSWSSRRVDGGVHRFVLAEK